MTEARGILPDQTLLSVERKQLRLNSSATEGRSVVDGFNILGDRMKNVRPLAKSIKDLSPIAFELGFYFNPIGNFSMIPLDDGRWLANFRVFQYWISSTTTRYWTGGHMKLKEPNIHHMCILDSDFNLLRQIRNAESTFYKNPISDSVPYLEDGRMVRWNGEIYISSATFYPDAEKDLDKMGLEVQKVMFDGLDSATAVHHWNTVEHGVRGRQKNWMPIPDRPFQYLVGTTRTGSQVYDISTDRTLWMGDLSGGDFFRGNTPLIREGDGYITLTHTVKCIDGMWTYHNHLVRYDGNLVPTSVSEPFKMCEYPIEFTTVLLHNGDGELMIGVTEMDDKPEMHIYDKEELFNEVGLL